MNVFQAFTTRLSGSVIERLGWVLLHSLWQFAVVGVLAGITVLALRRRSAASRYGVLVAALAVSVIARPQQPRLNPGSLTRPLRCPGGSGWNLRCAPGSRVSLRAGCLGSCCVRCVRCWAGTRCAD